MENKNQAFRLSPRYILWHIFQKLSK